MNASSEPASARPAKSASAFRTIGEVADDLDLPTHVLRFWESKFPQLKPLKRGGGRRYYRPEDIVLLRRIRQCLYQDGYTIRGVQKLLEHPTVAAEPDGEPMLFALAAAEPPADPPPSQPARRPPRRSPKPETMRPEMREALEDIRRELHEARDALAPLLPSPGKP